MMGDVPQVEPFVSTYYRAPAEADAPAIPLPARREENDFDAAVRFGDRTYLIDYTILSSPLSTKDKQAADQVALGGETSKREHYRRILPATASNDLVVTPLAFSALGRPTVLGLEFIRSMAKSLSEGKKVAYAVIFRRLLETISVALWRGNSSVMRDIKAKFGRTPRG
jgi:hypothetical protein